uniref:Uncharacterized protein n=1 Tax=Romanomermis culicivorax TaxID=13658 RepID=A0A915JDR1_ROMCU
MVRSEEKFFVRFVTTNQFCRKKRRDLVQELKHRLANGEHNLGMDYVNERIVFKKQTPDEDCINGTLFGGTATEIGFCRRSMSSGGRLNSPSADTTVIMFKEVILKIKNQFNIT